MTNYEKIKNMTFDELDNFLDNFDVEDIDKEFEKEFCDKCEPIECTLEGGNKDKFSPCELNFYNCTKYEHSSVYWWLNKETER